MRTIRSLTSIAAGAVLLAASSASAVNTYTFLGRLTASRGLNTNVPLAGNTNCGSLTLMSGGTMKTGVMLIARGQNTQPAGPLTPAFNWKLGKDMGCVKHAAGVTLQTTGNNGKITGGQFTIPVGALHLPYPKVRAPGNYMAGTDIPVAQIKYFAPVVQIATSVSITAPPSMRVDYGGTQGTMGGKGGADAHAVFRKFRANANATQTGRAGPNFTWCPPAATALGAKGNPACNPAAPPGIPSYIKYTGGTNAFGGTMSYVTHQVSGVGSIAFFIPGVFVGFNPFGGGEELATGRGYADYNMIALPMGVRLAKSATTAGTTIAMSKYIGPVLGNQNVINMVGMMAAGTQAAGKVYTWGFPWTTGTVVGRVKVVAGMGATTFTAMGWDCRGTMQGPNCSQVPAKGLPAPVAGKALARNISLVAGSLSLSRFASDTPATNFTSMQILPEPGTTLQLLAGVASLLGIAAWRARRVN